MNTTGILYAVLGVGLAAMIPGSANANHSTNHSAMERSAALGEVKFGFDSAALPGGAASLQDAVAFAAAHPGARIVLDAHCDPIGTASYNVGLAIRRAEAVRAQLTASGVPEDQIVFAIYGKDGERRASYADDRRVTLWPTRDSIAAVIEHTLAGRGTAVTWTRPLTTAQIESTPEPVASR